jgi:hypothetical protein
MLKNLREGCCADAAAQAIAKLGNGHDICVVRGGFKAWRESGLPTGHLRPSKEQSYLSKDSVLPTPLSPGGTTAPEVLLGLGSHHQPVFRPKLLDTFADWINGNYTSADLQRDVLSGATVGIIALSLSMALGIASESTPAIGLYTAVISGFLISALGGSKVCIGGPTAAFIPIVVGISHNYGAEVNGRD